MWCWWQTEDMILIYDIDLITDISSHLRTMLCFNTELSWGTEASSRLVRSSSRIRMRGGGLTDWLSNSIWKHRVNVAVRDKESALGVSLQLYLSGIFPESEVPPPPFHNKILTCCHWLVRKDLERRTITLEQRDWTAGHCSSILLPDI